MKHFFQAFVRSNFNVDFPLFSKVDVTGDSAHPVWKYLTEESKVTPEWNFYKYLVDHEGKIVNVYPPKVPVTDIFDEVEKAVKKARKSANKRNSTVKKDLKEEL